MTNAQLALPGLLPEASAEWVWADDPDEVIDVNRFAHAPVMRDLVVRALAPRPGHLYVDATLGGGGHASALLETEPDATVIGFDRDPHAIGAASERLAPYGARVRVVRSTFGRLRECLSEMGVDRVDGLVADLGVSSPQLDDASRGMSFRHGGPIDMRMDPDHGETALELIERTSDDELADVIFRYGEERRSRRIARSIHRAFRDGELETTLDLRRAIVRAVGPARVGGVDPATRTFQALRIAVNHELEELESLLHACVDVVAPGGVVAILSFHSLEDRLVKRAFASPDTWAPLWKKPQVAGEEESVANPRARSAKLRAARRVLPIGASAPDQATDEKP
jgi:16S rRNA (cytosine1402-N4)-methyltransferase